MNDKAYLRRCFELAKFGEGRVSPNPLVGSVIVFEDKIIGEGFHRNYGGPHAEVNAIDSVLDKSLLSSSTLYVNLEPCSHYGKTPPCAELIIRSGIPRVVISNIDPNPKVSNRGVRMMREAGVDVVTGILEGEGWEVNKRFFTYYTKKRPYVFLKWAKTMDGYMDIDRSIENPPYWISNDNLKIWVHKQRAFEDSILVGKNTIQNDNPSLSTRHYHGSNPIRLGIDRDLSLSTDLKFFDLSQKGILFNSQRDDDTNPMFIYKKIDFGSSMYRNILDYLYRENITSIIVEGGKATLEGFINNGLWDEANILVGNRKFGGGLVSPSIDESMMDEIISYSDNYIMHYRNKDNR